MKWSNKGHEFDDIGYLLKDKKHIFLYGAVETTKETIELIHALRKWIDWEIHIVDRSIEKQQSGMCGYPVISPQTFFEMKKENYFVVICATGNAEKQIRELIEENLESNVLLFSHFYFFYTYLSIYFVYMHDMVFFVSENMLPSTVCNLNCRDCLNFTPYIKKHHIAPLDELKYNIDAFFHAVDLIYRFQITGGEPLLYKHLQELLTYIDDRYGNQILRLEMVTNGTVVPSDSLCQFLHEKNIYVFLDDYRMSLPEGAEKYDKVKAQLEKYNVAFCNNYAEQWIRMYIPEQKKNQLSENELVQKYHICDNPWCSLREGKISSCNYAMYAETAGICQAEENEYYDLTQFNKEDKKRLIEFRLRYNEKGYTEFCKMCNSWTATNTQWCQPAIQCKKGE